MRPGSAYAALRATSGPCALLESTTWGGPLARASILAREPRALLVADPSGVRMTTAAGTHDLGRDAITALRALLRETPPARGPEPGGVVGALAYDFARPDRAPAPTPLLVALAVDHFEVFDAQREATTKEPPAEAAMTPDSIDLPSFSSLSRGEHRRLVGCIKERIAAGDIYQANLSQRFRVPWTGNGLTVYHHLRRLNPAPFSGYLRAPGFEIVSASPERLLLVDGTALSTRPIAGTRPRSTDPRTDDALAAELMLSEKERAEHLMLLDLARNDLGKVAVVGSVNVDEMMTVENYSHVRHIVSNVGARLAPEHDAFDALLAMFPGGTITGVPKIRCMEILDALEPVPRGFYTGSLFYATSAGRLDANILIRSAVVADGAVTFHTGGGIVADSDPDFEYAETLHKAEGMRVALEAALARG